MSSAFAQKIQDMRLSSKDAENMRFVVDVNDQAQIQLSRLENPARLVIDVKNASFENGVQQKAFDKMGFIKSIRTGKPTPTTCRIVLDLPSSDITEKHFTLAPSASAPWRFVIDLTNATPQTSIKPFSNDAQTVATQATTSPDRKSTRLNSSH